MEIFLILNVNDLNLTSIILLAARIISQVIVLNFSFNRQQSEGKN